MQFSKKISDDITLYFEWKGGPYIDVGEGGYGRAKEVINVWDYEKGEPSIPFTREAFKKEVLHWILEYPKLELVNDIRENWQYY